MQFVTLTSDDQDMFLELRHLVDQAARTTALLEVQEEGNVIEVTAELPGVAKEDIDLNLERNVLTIIAEKRGPGEAKRVHFSERSYGRFERSIQLPFVPDADSVSAEFQNGLLLIRFPRIDAQRTQRIEIRGARGEDKSSAIGANWEKKPAVEEPLRLTQKVRQDAADATQPRPCSSE